MRHGNGTSMKRKYPEYLLDDFSVSFHPAGHAPLGSSCSRATFGRFLGRQLECRTARSRRVNWTILALHSNYRLKGREIWNRVYNIVLRTSGALGIIDHAHKRKGLADSAEGLSIEQRVGRAVLLVYVRYVLWQQTPRSKSMVTCIS